MRLDGKNPCVVAGLVAALGAGAFVAVTPQALFAEELDGQHAAVAESADARLATDDAAGGSASAVVDKNAAQGPVASSGTVEEGSGSAGSTDASAEGSGSVGSTDASGEGSGSTSSSDKGAGESAGAPSKGDGTSEGDGAGVGESSEAEKDDSADSEQAGKDDSQEGAPSDKATQEEPLDEQAEEQPASGDAAAAPRQDAPAAAGWDASGSRYADTFTNPDGSVRFEWRKGWLVDATRGQGLQRYWFDSEGNLVSGRLVDPEADGSGYFAYARPDGVIVRGYYDAGNGKCYYADNDGRLWSEGWHVANIGQGLQRYYVESGSHAIEKGYSKSGYAHYTTSKGYVLRGASNEGGVKRYADNDGRLVENGWMVTTAFGQGLQRYWFSGGRVAASNQRVYTGNGTWAYVTSAGYVLRGKLDDGAGHVYLANNDGLLASGSGWLITGMYDNGSLQRYYLNGSGAAFSSFFDVVGYGKVFGVGGQGYVARGAFTFFGNRYYADNDGKISVSRWVVSNAYGQGLQRYWAQADGSFASGRKLTADEVKLAGWNAYITSGGYALRGKLDDGRGHVYLADNNGALASGKGWLVTGLYDGGYLQRYYLDGDGAALSGFFTEGGQGYFGLGGQGYVLRGHQTWGNHMLLADNNGVLASGSGWLVTAAYGGGAQRYWLELAYGDSYYGARIGEFTVAGSKYYGRDDTGYVVRGSYYAPNGMYYEADNNGKVTYSGRMDPLALAAWRRIMGTSSKTGYLIAVDVVNCRTFVFQGGAGNWTIKYNWLCTTGKPYIHDGQGTWRGTWEIGGGGASYNWSERHNPGFVAGGYRTEYYAKDNVSYFTCFLLDMGFHTSYGGDLGQRISNGCIRLEWNNAKWIYDNALPGTTVVTY